MKNKTIHILILTLTTYQFHHLTGMNANSSGKRKFDEVFKDQDETEKDSALEKADNYLDGILKFNDWQCKQHAGTIIPDKDQEETEKNNALEKAILARDFEKVKETIQQGAKVNNKKAPLEKAIVEYVWFSPSRPNNPEKEKIERQIIDFLLSKGAIPFQSAQPGNNAFQELYHLPDTTKEQLIFFKYLYNYCVQEDTDAAKANKKIIRKECVYACIYALLKKRTDIIKVLLFSMGDFSITGLLGFSSVTTSEELFDWMIENGCGESLQSVEGHAPAKQMYSEVKHLLTISPKDTEKYSQDKAKYKKEHADEFDPVLRFPDDFKDLYEFSQELHPDRNRILKLVLPAKNNQQ